MATCSPDGDPATDNRTRAAAQTSCIDTLTHRPNLRCKQAGRAIMYTENDLRDAVAAGAISGEAADALRAHVAGARTMPMTDEETFRLVNSFNDIFVTIAAVLLLVAMAGIGGAIS